MPFRFFDHTGDMGVEATAPSLDALFAEASRALLEAVTDPAGVGSITSDRVSLRAADPGLLLVDFLSELLYRFDTSGFLASEVHARVSRVGDGYTLDAEVGGERCDPARHPIRRLLKAVTYHALEVVETPGGWRARLVFDV